MSSLQHYKTLQYIFYTHTHTHTHTHIYIYIYIYIYILEYIFSCNVISFRTIGSIISIKRFLSIFHSTQLVEFHRIHDQKKLALILIRSFLYYWCLLGFLFKEKEEGICWSIVKNLLLSLYYDWYAANIILFQTFHLYIINSTFTFKVLFCYYVI